MQRSVRRLEADDAAVGRRPKHGPLRLRAEGDGYHAARDRRGRSARGAARRSRRVERISRRSRASDRKFGCDRLPDDDGARLPQRRDARGVGLGTPALVDRRVHLRRHIGRRDDVFDRDGTAVNRGEGPAGFVAPGRGIGGFARRCGVQGDERLDRAIAGCDRLEAPLQERAWCARAVAKVRNGTSKRQRLVHACCGAPSCCSKNSSVRSHACTAAVASFLRPTV